MLFLLSKLTFINHMPSNDALKYSMKRLKSVLTEYKQFIIITGHEIRVCN